MLEGPGQAVDLAGHLTFTYGAGETARAWDIQLYSDGATSTTAVLSVGTLASIAASGGIYMVSCGGQNATFTA